MFILCYRSELVRTTLTQRVVQILGLLRARLIYTSNQRCYYYRSFTISHPFLGIWWGADG